MGRNTFVETLGEKRTKDGATRERELYRAAAAQGLHGDRWGRAGTALQESSSGRSECCTRARAAAARGRRDQQLPARRRGGRRAKRSATLVGPHNRVTPSLRRC